MKIRDEKTTSIKPLADAVFVNVVALKNETSTFLAKKICEMSTKCSITKQYIDGFVGHFGQITK